MIRVNLLPVRTSKRQETVRTQLVMGGLGLAALLVVLFLFHGVMVARVASAQADVDELTSEVERMKAVAAQAEQAEKLKTDLERKLDVIKRLKANRTGPVRLLDELADASPEKVSLTLLDQDGDQIQLAGMAVSNEVISQFLSNLEQSAYFKDVYLNSIEQQRVGDSDVKVFSITARLVVPGIDEASVVEPKAG